MINIIAKNTKVTASYTDTVSPPLRKCRQPPCLLIAHRQDNTKYYIHQQKDILKKILGNSFFVYTRYTFFIFLCFIMNKIFREVMIMKKRIVAIMLVFVLALVFIVPFVGVRASDPPYNPFDVAAMNAIIEVNGLTGFMTLADPADGSVIPADWYEGGGGYGRVRWTNDGRIWGLSFVGFDLVGLPSNTLNISGLPYLTSLELDGNGSISSLNLSNLPAIDYLGTGSLGLTSLDLSGVPSLKTANIDGNEIATLNIAGLALEHLNAAGNRLTSINLGSSAASLRSLDLGANRFTTLEIADLPELVYLNVGDNILLENIIINNLVNATFINPDQPTPNAKYMFWGSDALKSVTMSGLPSFQGPLAFWGIHGALESLTLESMPGLTDLDLWVLKETETSKLASLSLSNLPGLTSLPLSRLPNLTNLELFYTGVDALDLSSVPSL
ncbi:MAG: hypothetical protein FWE90_12815, partial [Defluviitaleaceae bacterium]|nr:hypothetical protein [Defluviitaleaceae bacterium]